MAIDTLPSQNLDDVGTRYQHLTDLMELWQTGLEVMNKYDFDSDKENKVKLKNAIELLQKHIDNKSGYDFKAWSLRDTIERIPAKAESIEGGRGTPLREG